MKKIVILIAAILLSFLGWAILNHPTQPTGIELSIMKDRTDFLVVQPDTGEVFSLLNIDNRKWENIRLRTQTISNYEYNPIYTTNLPSHIALLSNPGDRENEIAKFKESVMTDLDSINNPQSGLPQSNIYIPIIREINRLSTSKASTKIIIIYSDLQENNSAFSIYKPEDCALLKQHPERVRTVFEHMAKPDSLHGVTVYLIFKAKNDKDNQYFMLMSHLLETLLGEAGAQVKVGTNVVVDNS